MECEDTSWGDDHVLYLDRCLDYTDESLRGKCPDVHSLC